MTTDDLLESYITRFRFALAGMTLDERQDIVEEIRTHIHERVSVSGMSVEETLERLGPAEALAREYRRGALVRKASTAFSPWLILRAAFAWAMTGVYGAVAFGTAIFGYSLAFGFMLCSLLKMVFPDEIGLWIGPDFDIGFRAGDVPVGHEVLGKWFEPISFGLGLLFLSLTMWLMRALLPRFRQWRTTALSHVGIPSIAIGASVGLARSASALLGTLYQQMRQMVSNATAKRPDEIRDLRG